MAARAEVLTQESADPALWGDRERAEKVGREKRALERELSFFTETDALIEEAGVLAELAAEAGDADTAKEAETKIGEIRERIDGAELRRLLSGEYDAMNAIVTINAGAGGTESCDWADMLVRMYLRWCELHDYKCEMIDYVPAEEAGIKSATFSVEGDHVYGYLKTEVGVHRLVRISPFDAQKRRHTSFASFAMVPDIGDEIEVEIEEKDLRVDTYRAGGAGGQHVNRTDSAVRITHIPTGIVVQCQNERSQHKNRASAMKVLKARLFEKAEREKREQIDKIQGEKSDNAFGSQIRSYTLHPTQRVKDHRTMAEVGNADSVLAGNIDVFIRARLLQAAEGG
jgi:peptide chain release factor 2